MQKIKVDKSHGWAYSFSIKRNKGRKNDVCTWLLLLLFWLELTPQRTLSILAIPSKTSDSFANRFFNSQKNFENHRFSIKYIQNIRKIVRFAQKWVDL